MKDPFPIAPPAFLDPLATKLVQYTHLPTLPLHLHEILISAITYQIICYYVSPIISKALFPRTYPALNSRTKINWDVHVVSLFQSCIINAFGLYLSFYDDERNAMDWQARIWAYDGALGCIAGLAVGYFLWDLLMSLYHVKIFGVGLLAHAASALTVYSFGFRPIVMWYAPVFILFELSSPFLNFHWFSDKVGMTGSTAQLINGIFLTSSFFLCRLVWGTYNCFRVFPDFMKALQYQDSPEGQAWLKASAANATANAAAASHRGDVLEAEIIKNSVPQYFPIWIAGVYLGSYLILMLLNVYWFGKMIETIRARFEPPIGTKKDGKKEHVVMGRGLDDDGIKSIEVDAQEVRQRKQNRKI